MAHAHSAIPFPSSPSRSMHVSPSQWYANNRPSQFTSVSQLGSALFDRDSSSSQVEFSHRFSSPTPTQASSSSQQKAQGQRESPERPSQSHTPLTPPLTPGSISGFGANASAENGVTSGGSSAFATPARGPAAPPPTPASAGLSSYSNSNSMSSHMGPPSPVTVGTNTNSNMVSEGGWLAPASPRRARPFTQRLEVAINGCTGANAGATGSPCSERSVDLGETLPESDCVVLNKRPGDANVRDGSTGGERYLLVGNVPKDASEAELRDAFHLCGELKGICLRFQEAEGFVILVFYDCRHTAHAEQQINAQGQTFFNGRRLRTEKKGAVALRKLMGDFDFINETESELLVTADGNIDSTSLQSIANGFGELRAFSQTNVANSQAYIAEYFDCRHARNAMEALNERSIFGIRLCLVLMHTATEILTRAPFQQNGDNGKQFRQGGSQPTSPLNVNSPFTRVSLDSFAPQSRQDQTGHDSDAEMSPDTSNSSPFHGTRCLPLVTPVTSHSLVLHSGGGRRISTGSVGVLPGGSALHQSTSEQDLRRRAAANNAACANAHDGWFGDHMRRTSDTFCFDALRRAAGDIIGTGQMGPMGISSLGRPRTRAISESSASPRVVSPSEGFSTAGMDVELPVRPAFEDTATPDNNTSSSMSGYYHDDRDNGTDVDRSAHTRMPTASDSSPGGPHTPSPGPVAYNVNPYYINSPSMLGVGLPGMIAPHHTPNQYYLGSPLVGPASPVGLRYGYAPQTTGYSPGGLNVRSNGSSPSSLHPPSHSSFLYSPTRAHHAHAHLPSSARGALDVTREPPTERNQVDLERISAGLDTRTTVMIKNIPNKLTDKDLVEFIGRVCPRKINFCYLRMDFQNGCNVGYAFVNFIYVEDLLHFARTKLGVKWNMFSSEKVLQMSYANYQGKEALVEKFKNSCVMDEREAWRPKIFYSNGPNQGLPEPFPSPTHYRRKERSAQNRGTLFVPNAHGHSSSGGMEAAERATGLSMLGAPFRRPNQHPQNLSRQDRY